MVYNTITDLIATAATFRAGQIVDGQLNPIHLAIATTGYRMQSQTLRIPDRFGIFSSRPPRLQVYEAAMFVSFALFQSVMIANAVVFFVFYKWTGLPNPGRVGAMIFALEAATAGGMLVWACNSEKRVPGYKWDDEKMGAEGASVGRRCFAGLCYAAILYVMLIWYAELISAISSIAHAILPW